MHNGEVNKFSQGDYSWDEARIFNDLAVQALGADHPLAHDIAGRLRGLVPVAPDTAGLGPTRDPRNPISCGDVKLTVGSDGSVAGLVIGGAEWATASSSLFALTYTTYNRKESWDPKVNLTAAEAEDAVWRPSTTRVLHNGTESPPSVGGPGAVWGAVRCRVVVEMAFAPSLHTKYGAPLTASLELDIDPPARSIAARLSWFNKSTTRLPESLMVSFHDQGLADHGWAYDVLGSWVGVGEVGRGTTNPFQRGVWDGIRYSRL